MRASFAWFFGIFAAYETPVQRADAFRYFALSAYGGVYAYECVVPLDSYVATLERPIGFVSPTREPHSISNSLMISAHAPELWTDILYELIPAVCSAIHGLRSFFPRYRVLRSTGPGMLRAWLERSQVQYVCSLERRLFSPCHFCEPACDATDAYAVHHYGKSWNRWDSTIINWWNCRSWSPFVMAATFFVCVLLLRRLRRRALPW